MILKILLTCISVLLFVFKEKVIVAWKQRCCVVMLGRKGQKIKDMFLHLYLNNSC